MKHSLKLVVAVGLTSMAGAALAGVSPPLYQAGYNCKLATCGDYFSPATTDGGIRAPNQSTEPYGTKAYIVGYEIGAGVASGNASKDPVCCPTQSCSFACDSASDGLGCGACTRIHLFDPDISDPTGAGNYNDTDTRNGDLDTGVTYRIYPPRWTESRDPACATEVLELRFAPGGGPGAYENCQEMFPAVFGRVCNETNLANLTSNFPAVKDCCDAFDRNIYQQVASAFGHPEATVLGDFVTLNLKNLVDAGLNPLCAAPGTWYIEIDTSAGEFSGCSSPNCNVDALNEDINYYEVAVSSGRSSDALVRTFMPYIPLANPAGEAPPTFTFTADTTGGWVMGVDTTESANASINRDNVEFSSAYQLAISGSPQLEKIGNLAPTTADNEQAFYRRIAPFDFLGSSSRTYNGINGYPINVPDVNSQGLWWFTLRPDVVDTTIPRISVFRLGEHDPASGGITLLGEFPSVENSHELYFLHADLKRSDLDLPWMDPSAPIGSSFSNAEISERLVDGDKPSMRHFARRLGRNISKGFDCWEITLGISNPGGGQNPGNVLFPDHIFDTAGIGDAPFGMSTFVPGTTDQPTGASARFVGLLDCGLGSTTLTPVEVFSNTCPTGATGVPGACTCPPQMRTIDCSAVSFDGGTGPLQFHPYDGTTNRSTGVVSPGEATAARYMVAVRYGSSAPNEHVFFHARDELGPRGYWRTEGAPDIGVDYEPFNYETRFGAPADGSTKEAEPTTSTSGDTTEAEVTRASIIDVGGGVLADERPAVRFSTASEYGTVAFRILDANSQAPLSKWLTVGPPHARGADYEVVIELEEALPQQILILEAENSGRQRQHGPFAVDFSTALDGSSDFSLQAHPFVPRVSFVQQHAEVDSPSGTGIANVLVKESGVVRVSRSDLAAALGVSLADLVGLLASDSVNLERGGVALPFDSDLSNLYFLAEVPRSETYDGEVYRFVVGSRGQKISFAPADAPLASDITATFRSTAEFERDLVPATASRARLVGNDREYWMWKFIAAGAPELDSFTQSFDLPGLATGAVDGATLRVRLRGGSDSPAYPDHRAAVSLNGTTLGTQAFEFDDSLTLSFEVPAAELAPTNNQLSVAGVLGPDVPFSVFYVDSFEIEYPREYVAAGPQLTVSGAGLESVTVRGFANPPRLWRIGNDGVPVHLTDVTHAMIEGKWAATIDNQWQHRSYVAFDPESLVPAKPRPSRASAFVPPATEYLVIAPEALLAGANQLASLRSELSPAVVSLEALYDTYSYGRADPSAIHQAIEKSFAAGRGRLRYVVLLGDGSFDSRNKLGLGDSLVPPRMYRTPDGRFGADVTLGFADVTAGLDIAVGRLPFLSNLEVAAYVEKLQAFESSSATNSVLVSDNDDAGGAFGESAALALDLVDELTATTTFSLGEDTVDGARTGIENRIAGGLRWLHYLGHGAMDRLADEGVLTFDDVDGLTNSEHPFVLLAATCLVGRYETPGVETLAEKLLLADGGAAAVFASSALSFHGDAAQLVREAHLQGSSGAHKRIGAALVSAANAALAAGVSANHVATHTLLGDPAMVLNANADEWRTAGGGNTLSEDPDPNSHLSTSRGAQHKGSGGCSAAGGPALLSLLALTLLIRWRRI